MIKRQWKSGNVYAKIIIIIPKLAACIRSRIQVCLFVKVMHTHSDPNQPYLGFMSSAITSCSFIATATALN